MDYKELKKLISELKSAKAEAQKEKQIMDAPELLSPITSYYYESAKKKEIEIEKIILENIQLIQNCIFENERMKRALKEIRDLTDYY